ncbi:uncharacterized protein LOC110273092 [Arachis duranensis]|uniref:Uncharacterized protein LOC110273092 n=1 Tax=Arachis duranensis TaxID=130453 RepID=A0A6P5MB36_ARADU|nr:uncharacterized protein LOC110273092 [Arachis duranensis]
MGNGTSSTSSKSKVQQGQQVLKGVHYYANNKPRREQQQQQQHYGLDGGAVELLETDEAFSEYIRRAKQNMRTVSYVGNDEDHSNYPAPVVNNNVENENEEFSEFIRLTKKKLRTASFQRG